VAGVRPAAFRRKFQDHRNRYGETGNKTLPSIDFPPDPATIDPVPEYACLSKNKEYENDAI
jgi:hypothetical protein